MAGRRDLKGLRAAVSADFGFALLQPEVKQAFESATASFAELGCELVEAHPRTEDPVPLWMTIAHAEGFASEGPLLDKIDLIDPDTARTVRMGETISSREYLDARERQRELSRVWASFLEDFDFVVSPGQQVLPFVIGDPDPSDPGGDQETEGRWWGMDAIANLTGQPVTAVPWDLAASGLPVGVQLMARRFEDSAAPCRRRHMGVQRPEALDPPLLTARAGGYHGARTRSQAVDGTEMCCIWPVGGGFGLSVLKLHWP